MGTKYNVVFIIPLHKKDELVARAFNSTPKSDFYMTVIVCNQDIADWLGKSGIPSEHILVHDSTKYTALCNAGIEEYKSDTEFISILEYDDMLSDKFKEIYNSGYFTDTNVGVFAPLACVMKEVEGQDKPTLLSFVNEVPFAPGMSEEEGKYDFNMMLKSNFLFLNGCFIRPGVFEEVGVLKENFEMFYDYEFNLRMIYNGIVIKSIPKATHLHTMNKSGAWMEHTSQPKGKREEWLGLARREYFFTEQRELDLETS